MKTRWTFAVLCAVALSSCHFGMQVCKLQDADYALVPQYTPGDTLFYAGETLRDTLIVVNTNVEKPWLSIPMLGETRSYHSIHFNVRSASSSRKEAYTQVMIRNRACYDTAATRPTVLVRIPREGINNRFYVEAPEFAAHQVTDPDLIARYGACYEIPVQFNRSCNINRVIWSTTWGLVEYEMYEGEVLRILEKSLRP